jgi:putative transposase
LTHYYERLQRLQRLIGAKSYDDLVSSHRGWVEEYLAEQVKSRQEEWTSSIAVGSRPFIEKVKALLGFRAMGRAVIEGAGGCRLREGEGRYRAAFEAGNDDIDVENTYSWDNKAE